MVQWWKVSRWIEKLTAVKNIKDTLSTPQQKGLRINILKPAMTTHMEWTYWLSGYDYRVATLSKLYLTYIGIIIPSLKLIWQF